MKIQKTSAQKGDLVKVKIIKLASVSLGTSVISLLLLYYPLIIGKTIFSILALYFPSCDILNNGIISLCLLGPSISVVIIGGVLTAFLINEKLVVKILYGFLASVVSFCLIILFLHLPAFR